MNRMTAWYKFWGRVWVPTALRHLDEPVILHLSDTPAPFFSALPGLIRNLNPTWVIHTGDLVDDVKLGLNPAHLSHYSAKVNRLVQLLETSDVQGIYLCMGNHDDSQTLRAICQRSQVISCSERLLLGGMSLGASHYASEALAVGGDVCLFGHNMDVKTDLTGTPQVLNGLEAIHFIMPRSGRIVRIPYPTGTDDQRLGRGKVGL